MVRDARSCADFIVGATISSPERTCCSTESAVNAASTTDRAWPTIRRCFARISDLTLFTSCRTAAYRFAAADLADTLRRAYPIRRDAGTHASKRTEHGLAGHPVDAGLSVLTGAATSLSNTEPTGALAVAFTGARHCFGTGFEAVLASAQSDACLPLTAWAAEGTARAIEAQPFTALI